LLFSPDLADWLPVGPAFIGSEIEEVHNFFLSQIEGQPTPPDKQFWRVKVEDVDSDGDGLTDAEECVIGTDPDNPQSVAVNKHGQILFNPYDRYGVSDAFDKALWNSATREWVSLAPEGEMDVQGDPTYFWDDAAGFSGINDDGMILGYADSPFQAGWMYVMGPGMYWKRTGDSLLQYDPPRYFVVNGAEPDGYWMVLPKGDSRAIAEDGTFNSVAWNYGNYETNPPITPSWMTFDSSGSAEAMTKICDLSQGNSAWYTSSCVLDQNRSLLSGFLEYPNPYLLLQDGVGEPENVSFLATNVYDKTDMSLAPSGKDGGGDRRLTSTTKHWILHLRHLLRNGQARTAHPSPPLLWMLP
jgi:hypothetical protein